MSEPYTEQIALLRRMAEGCGRNLDTARARIAQLERQCAAKDAECEGLERRIRAALGAHSDSAQWWQSWAQQAIRWLELHRDRAALADQRAEEKKP